MGMAQALRVLCVLAVVIVLLHFIRLEDFVRGLIPRYTASNVQIYTRTAEVIQNVKTTEVLKYTTKPVTTPQYKPTDLPEEVQTYKMNWAGDCSYPDYIPRVVQAEAWFPLYLSHLQRVNFSSITVARRHINCARWWYATPQVTYDEVPHRRFGWKPKPKPYPGYIRPKCTFGQELVKKTPCASKYEILWRTLDKLGILYFPRCGTELGILRGSHYVTSDGDLDIFVDMPQDKLVKELRNYLRPPPFMSSPLSVLKAETHWKVKGCPTVHIVFNDWMADEMVKDVGRPTFNDTCTCMMNSVPLSCHRMALRRTWLMYGPSWMVPLHVKGMDVPHRARPYNSNKKLKALASKRKDGIIDEKAVRALGPSINYSEKEMHLILAHLNVLKALIDYQEKTKKYKWV